MATLKASTFSERTAAVSHYLELIDKAATQARQIDPAQAELYQRKVAEAEQGKGLLLEAEATVLGKPFDVVAQAVLVQRRLWQAKVEKVELLRIKAKGGIRGAKATADMYAIYHGFMASLGSLD